MKQRAIKHVATKKAVTFQKARLAAHAKHYQNIHERNQKIHSGVRKVILTEETSQSQRTFKNWLKFGIISSLILCVILALSAVTLVRSYSQSLPDLTDARPLVEREYKESIILDRNGKELYRLRDENIVKERVRLNDVPEKLKWAFLAAEDAQFFEHRGLNLIGTVRALLCSLNGKEIKECGGGSSVTQQLVKITSGKNEQTYDRKIREAFASIKLEKTETKDQILEDYLNMVPQGGILVGVKTGSKYLFGKENLHDLSLAEMAYLASIANEPTTLSPWGNIKFDEARSHDRASYVLDRMLAVKEKTGVNEEEILEAKKAVPMVNFKSKDIEKKAPHFVDYVLTQLDEMYRDKMPPGKRGADYVRDKGYIITTTVDLESQEILEKSIRKQVKSEEFQKEIRAQNGAGVIMDPKNGDIIALVGSRDFNEPSNDPRFSPQHNAALLPRSLGSTMKPALYLTAFRMGYNPGTLVPDKKLDLREAGAISKYEPQNYNREYSEFGEMISMRTGLRWSLNVPAVATYHLVGKSNYIDTYQRLNGEKLQIGGPSAPLGAANMSLLNQVHAYTTLAGEGMFYPKRSILEIKDEFGTLVFNNRETKGKQLIDKKHIYLINDLNKAYWLFKSDKTLLNVASKMDIAGKTGSGDREDGKAGDIAFIAYTPTITMGMWAGNSCGLEKCPLEGAKPTGENLYKLAFKPFLEEYVDKIEPAKFVQPEEVIEAETCYQSLMIYRYKDNYRCDGATKKRELKALGPNDLNMDYTKRSIPWQRKEIKERKPVQERDERKEEDIED